MGFWIWMFVVAILCPTIMIIAGTYFRKSVPKKINTIFGYRTTMSMKNRDTWDFAHKYIGNLWSVLGFALIVPSAVPTFFLIGKSEDLISVLSLIICFVGMATIIACIVPTEKALKRNFDKDGNKLN